MNVAPIPLDAALRHALVYAQRGWHVFPCNPLTKKPMTPNGYLDASTDPDIIREWWRRSPNAMIGCATGPKSGFWALDADMDADEGKDGIAEVAKLGPPLPDTVEQTTPRGGHHKLFRWDESRPVRNSVSKLARGVDTRGDGGYVILAGSVRKDGTAYQWAISPENGEIREAPDWLYEEIRKARVKAEAALMVDLNAHFPFVVEKISDAAAAKFKEQCLIVSTTESGSRNDTLNRAAFEIGLFVGRGEIPAPRVVDGLMWAAGRCGLIDDDGEDSARKTVRSGLEAGAAEGVKQTPAYWHEEPATPENDISVFPVKKIEPPPALDGTPYDFPDISTISPRQFLYGSHYLRDYISATIAPTKVGKTSLGVVEALAMCSGKPLLGVQPTGLWRVRIWNGEDPREEIVRRIAAAMQEYGLTREDIGDRLFVDSGREMPICTATQLGGKVTITRAVVSALSKSLLDQRIDILMIDPFIKSHGVTENDNVAIDQVAREWNGIAGACHVAIDLVHHSRKTNGGEASLEDARGASALVSAARSGRVLARMTKDEAKGLPDKAARHSFFRFADAASNMAVPAGDDATWMRLKSVDLHNGTFDEDGKLLWPSDKVGVVRLADVKAALVAAEEAREALAPPDAEREALEAVGRFEWRLNQRAGDWVGIPIARAYGFDLDDADDRETVKTLIKKWVSSRKIEEFEKRDEKGRPRPFVRVYTKIEGGDLFG